MKDNFFEKLNRTKQKIRLNEIRKKVMRDNLLRFMDSPVPVRRSWIKRLFIQERSKSIFKTKNLFKPMPLIAGITIVTTMFGGGIAFASQTSLPGETLYPVKILTENIRGDLTLSTEGKAEWSVDLAARRLEEASVLAAAGRMNATSSAEIASRFEENTHSVKKNIEKLKEEGNIETAANINSQLESSFKVHNEILVRLEKRDPDLKNVIGFIREKIKEELKNTEKEGHDLDEVIINASSSVKVAAEGKIKAAGNVIDETQKFINNKNSKLSAETSADAENKLGEASSTLLEAKAKLNAGLYSEAFSLAKEAMEKAQETKAIVQAQALFNIRIEDLKDREREKEYQNATSSEEIEYSTSSASSSHGMEKKENDKEKRDNEKDRKEGKSLKADTEANIHADIQNKEEKEIEGEGGLKFKFEF